MKRVILFSLFFCFRVSAYSQQFSFANEDGVVFNFNVKRDSDKLSLSLMIENTSKNMYVFIDSSSNYSFNRVGDTMAFMGIGFDYSFYPYTHDIMRRSYKVIKIGPSKKFTQLFTRPLATTEQVKILRIGFDYFVSDKKTDFNEKTQSKIISKHRCFNFSIPVANVF